MAVAKKSTHKNAARSRQMIKKAFAELLNEKDLAKITVTDIVDRAGISRGTFYAHYLDVYDLYNAIQSNMMEAIDLAITSCGEIAIVKDPAEIISKGVLFLKTKKDYYKLFITSSRSEVLIDRIINYVFDRLFSEIKTQFYAEEMSDIEVFLIYSLGAVKNVVISWLDDSLNITAEKCIDLLISCYNQSKPIILDKLTENIEE